jgi:hypothetical protein
MNMITLRRLATIITSATSFAWISGISSFHIPFNHPLPDSSLANNFVNQSTALAQVPAQSNSPILYVPPKKIGKPKKTSAAGTRGCDALSKNVSLTLLVPKDHIGRTISAHPSFYWYVSTPTNIPIRFTLIEPNVPEPIFVQQQQVQKSGIMKLEIPKERPELVPGRSYVWTVTILCDPNRPSTYVVHQSKVERVALTPEQSSKLAAATSEGDQALIYAQEGFWYNALDTLANAYIAQPKDQSILDNLMALLKQIDLAQITVQNWQQFQVKR